MPYHRNLFIFCSSLAIPNDAFRITSVSELDSHDSHLSFAKIKAPEAGRLSMWIGKKRLYKKNNVAAACDVLVLLLHNFPSKDELS